MATLLGTVLADFTTSLATALAVGGTSASLQSATDDDGVALPSGTYYFTIDGSNSSKEHIRCTLSGTSLTSIYSVSRQGVATSGVARVHRIGASVSLTDFAHLKVMNDLLSGATNLNASEPLEYDGTATIDSDNQLATKAYADGLAIAGSPDSSTTTKGIGKVSVAPASASNPIFVGDNDGRVPTQEENDAQVGNNTDIAVGTGNKFVTQTGLQKNAETYAATATGNDTYVVTLSPVPTSLVNGMTIKVKFDVANTGASTLNVNGLGALAIVTSVGTATATGDIVANLIGVLVYNSTGTVWQLTNPASMILIPVAFANGTTTKDAADASGVQNIAHGLGVAPRKVNITAILNGATAGLYTSIAKTSYNGTTQSSISTYSSLSGSPTTNATFRINTNTATSNNITEGVVTVDATNIIITWTKTGSPTGIYYLLWDAIK